MRGHGHRDRRRGNAREPADSAHAGEILTKVENHSRDWILLIVLCAVGAGLGKLQSQARNNGASDLVTHAIRSVYQPIAGVLTSLFDSVSDFSAGILSSSRLTVENDKLRAAARGSELYIEQSKRYEEELDRLRKMIALPEIPGKTRVPASVWGYFPNESRATLNAGRDKGVRKGMPVIAAEGLYGQVQTVDVHSCQVLLISSPQFRIMGRVERDPPPLGFIQGQSTGAMVFDVVDAKALPQISDRVYTSGLSERIPAGLLIGTIVQKEEDVAYGSKRCQVYPAVTIGAIREVFILK